MHRQNAYREERELVAGKATRSRAPRAVAYLHVLNELAQANC